MTAEVKNTNIWRARAFLFTINEIDKYDALKEIISNLKTCDYYVSAKEVAPTTGHEHIHMYCHFTSSYRLSKKILELDVHIDKCQGSPKQVINYVKKDGNIIDEYGICPRQGGMKTVGELKDIKNPDELNSNEYNTWLKIHTRQNNIIKIDDIFKNIKVYYIHGPSGIGKSKRAFEIAKENGYDEITIVSYEGGFWNGVNTDCKVAIYDEFRDSCMKPSEFIKFIDYNKHHLNIKGGSELNNYELIIITSVQDPKKIYPNIGDEPREQWLRRMEIIDMNPEPPKPIITYYNYDDDE